MSITASAATTFGALLRRYRLTACLSQEALAERARLSVSAIASLERGRHTSPRPETVALLADALGLDALSRAALIAAAGERAAPSAVAGAGSAPNAAAMPPPAQLSSATPRAAGPPALEERPAARSTLPLASSPLIGREREEAAVTHLAQQEGTRLLTLTGPGGVGKTHLALAVAQALQHGYDDGAVFVDLSALRDPALVAPTVAQALGLHESGAGAARDALQTALREKRILLVLDNFEQVLEAAPLVVDLASSCPYLTMMVTSRTALRVRAEQRFDVPPLEVPDASYPDLPALANCAAVRLFVARAQAAEPGFQLHAENAAAVAAICQRLDGVPLAIELAAPWVTLLPPAALLGRLERRLPVLRGRARDVPARQQTLRATLDWSYALLSAREQALFRTLSVFAGGCTLEAAEAAAALHGPRGADVPASPQGDDVLAEPQGGDVLAGLEALVDHSLLRSSTQSDGTPRFHMLETVREYGLEQLTASGEEAQARRWHAGYYLALAEAADPHLRSGERKVWLERLHREADNLRAALSWSAGEPGAAPLGLRLAVALTWFWRFYEWLDEGRSWLDTMLQRTDDLEQTSIEGQITTAEQAITRGKALYGSGMLAWYHGDVEAAARRTEAGVSLFRACGDGASLATALRLLGLIRMGQGDPPAARAILEESRALFHQEGDRWGEAMTLYRLGLAAAAMDDPAARACYEQSLALFRQIEDTLGVSVVLNALAVAAAAHGDDAAALAIIAECLPLAREATDRWDLARLLTNAGTLHLRRGETQQARELFAESLHLWAEIGHRAGIALALAGLGGVAAAQGRVERAGRLFGAARRIEPSTGPVVIATSDADLNKRIADARAGLDAGPFEAGWAAGQTLSLDDAIREALADE